MLLHIAVPHAFLLPSNIPLYDFFFFFFFLQVTEYLKLSYVCV